ncbi:hypothetical protein N566_24070 [Streptomycetaceae bacterium MP113-05]|nr:hypothetical protein N566_24070 [Streptomycetaceae bacterium MP113-05]
MDDDVVVRALGALVPGGVSAGELVRGGRALRWVEAGSGGPPIVLVAAGGTPALTWAPVLPALAEKGRVVAYDRAGIGMSDPATPLTLESAVEDLATLLSRLGGGPCVLVGNSWGGQLAQLVAWQAPELVAGLVLVDPAHEEFEPWLGRVLDGAFVQVFALRMVLGLAEGALRKQAEDDAGRATDDPRARELLVDAGLACCASRAHIRTVRAETRLITANGPEIRRRRAGGRLPDVPLTVLSATQGLPKGMRARWTALQAATAEAARRGRHEEVPDAGHYVHRFRPDVVTRAIQDVGDLARRDLSA